MIWCVEDDKNIREIEIYTLKSTGFDARGFDDGASFFKALQHEKPQLIILDIMLSGEDGVEILKKLKASKNTKDIPVIMATAKGMEYDKVQSLDEGADDYLVKPFGMMEMVSRVKAVLRRCNVKEETHEIELDGLYMNLEKRVVKVLGKQLELTYKEFELLKLFMMYPGVVFTREQLFQDIWGEDFVGESRTIDMHVRTLRQKMGSQGKLIKTIRNVGYKLEVKD